MYNINISLKFERKMLWYWYLIFFAVWIVGLVGCVLPVIPGPLIAYGALLLMQLSNKPPFSVAMMLFWGILTLIITILDYWVPIYGTKKAGGTKWGSNGAIIGMIVGMFLGPLGLFIGAFIGAFVGEILNKQSKGKALKAAMGSFLGFIAGVFGKIVFVLMILAYFFIGVIF